MVSLPLVFAPVPRADRLPLRHPPLGARLAAGALHLVRHAAAVRRPRDHAVRAAGPVRRRPRPGDLSARSARRSPSCWSAPACTRPRPPASRWRPTSPRPRRGRGSWRCSTSCCWSAWWRARSSFGALLADFGQRQADPGDPGRGRGHDGAQPRRAVEAGGARPVAHRAATAPRPAFARVLARLHRRRPRRAGCWSRSGSAPRPSACRTSCSSPMAARSCISRSAATTALTALLAARRARRLRARRARCSAAAPTPTGSPALGAARRARRLRRRDLRRPARIRARCSAPAPC